MATPKPPPIAPAEDPFPDMERDVTLGLLGLNLFVFLIEPGLREQGRQWFEMRYSLSLDGIRAGHWWQFFTYQFLHGNWVHLGANLVLLHSMGPILETTLGRRRFFGLYLASGAIGGLVQLVGAMLSPKIFGHPVVGASAGLCGLLAALGALYAEEKVKGYLFFLIPFELKAKFVLLLAGVLSIIGSVFPFGNIAHLAHLGGLLGGLCCINLMDARPLPPADPEPKPAHGPRN